MWVHTQTLLNFKATSQKNLISYISEKHALLLFCEVLCIIHKEHENITRTPLGEDNFTDFIVLNFL